MSNPAIDGIHLTKEYARKKFVPTDLQWTITKIAENFTLYDLFRLAYRAEVIIPGICAAFGMPHFDKFWEQINLPRKSDDVDDVEYLELYWSPDYTGQPNSSLGEDDENLWDDPKICEMPNLMSFHGIGPGCPSANFHKCDNDCPRTIAYGIAFSPVNNLAHLPIRVSPKVDFFPPFVESDRNFDRTGFQLTIEPTLWCFITSIFWELTFAGTTPIQ